MPRALQIGLMLVIVAAVAGGTYYGRTVLKKRTAAGELAAAWGEYETAARKSDLAAIGTALDRVLAVAPGNPIAIRYKAMIASGEADPDTPGLALVLLHDHIAGERLPEAAREAEKVLAMNPKEWQARCALAHHALQVRKDRDLAMKHLDLLPDPEDPAAGVRPGGVLYALRLSAAVGRDAESLRRVIVRRLVPLIRSGSAAAAPAAVKAQLVECYLEPFVDPASHGELAAYWGAADRLAEDGVAEVVAAGDISNMIRFGALSGRMRAGLAALRESDPAAFSTDRYAALAKAVDDRTRRVWTAIREKAPDRSEGYLALAALTARTGDLKGAKQQILDGLAACGDRAELLETLVAFETRHGTDEEIRTRAAALWQAAEAAKTDPAKWYLAAATMIAAGRHDFALDACKNVRAIQPDHPAACQTEAWLRLRTGDPTGAREALAPLGETVRRTNPALARLYARASAETVWVLVGGEFDAIVAAQAALRPPTSAPAVAFLRGILDAAPDAERAEWVATRAAHVLSDDPTAPDARHIRAQALYRLADLSVTANPKGGAPVWDAGRVAAALRAIQDLTAEEQAVPNVVAVEAALQLKGQGNAPAAYRTAAPLRAAENALTAPQLEVLGAVLTASDLPADAVRVLERASRFPRASAGCWVALAVAYYKNGQPDRAAIALARAEQTPERSAREQAELVAAKQLVRSENP